MIRTLLVVMLLLLPSGSSWAACDAPIGATRNAPTWADVAACHTAASDGDTITVTAGNYTVTATTTITKYVKIVASGTVTITDNVANGSNLLAITESTIGSTRLQGFSFVQGTGQHANPQGVIKLSLASDGKPILIAGNSYVMTIASGDFIIAGVNRGVIWGNTITGTTSASSYFNNAAFIRHKPSGQTSIWTSPATWGSADTNGDLAFYVEGNTATMIESFVDVDDDAVCVVRYNTLTNAGVFFHGNDTSAEGARRCEIYNNTFVWDATTVNGNSGPQPPNVNFLIPIRGGTAIVANNVIPNVTSSAWGNKNEVVLFQENLRRNGGPYACYTGGYPVPHQVGWGYVTGATQANATGVFQDLEPVYLWGNTGAGNYTAPTIQNYPCNDGSACDFPDTTACNARDSASTYIIENREYYLATAKPGYTPYTYPHPLTLSAAANSSISGGVQLQGGATIK